MHEGQLTEIYDSLIDNLALSRHMLTSPIHMYMVTRPIQGRRIRRGPESQGASSGNGDKALEPANVPWLPAGLAFTDLVWLLER